MKCLFITNGYLNENSGGVYATKAYINAFASLSESLTLVYAAKEGMDVARIFDDNVKMIPILDNRSKLRKFVELCLGIVNRFQKNLFDYIDIKDYDTVIFNNSDVSSGLIKRVKQYGLKVITIHHNYQIEYIIGDSSKLLLLPLLVWTFIYEGIAVRHSDLNLTLTEQDIDLLKKHYGGSHYDVIGVFEYEQLQKNENEESIRGHHYVITGWLGSKQTEDSLIPWIKNYYPLLKKIDPLAELTIAGRNPSEQLCILAQSAGIKVIASPVDMQPILNSADYYICPTDRGGGLKLRNMDGLKSGLSVLTHLVSARGYEYMQNLGIVRPYYDADSFISGIQALLSSNKSKNDIIVEYQNYYSLDAGIRRLEKILKKWQPIF